ncbi:hypothetical protein [Burkholderia mayonis]|nr:hypothetical protein [Burkholderia mayonis]
MLPLRCWRRRVASRNGETPSPLRLLGAAARRADDRLAGTVERHCLRRRTAAVGTAAIGSAPQNLGRRDAGVKRPDAAACEPSHRARRRVGT